MNLYGQLIPAIAAGLYLFAFLLWLPVLVKRNVEEAEGLRGRLSKHPAAWVCLVAAFILHTAAMVGVGVQAGRCPVGNARELFQFVSWSIMATYCIVGLLFRSALAAFITSFFTGILCIFSLGMSGGAFKADLPPLVMAHAGLSLFAYGAFALIALTSFMYLLQIFGIRRRRLANVFILLPSLKELESVNLRLLKVGLFVYVVALGVGLYWHYAGGVNVSVAKFLFAVLVLAGYAGALFLRLIGQLYGTRLAVAGLFLFALALATLLPVQRSALGDHDVNRAAELQNLAPPSGNHNGDAGQNDSTLPEATREQSPEEQEGAKGL